MTATVEPVEIVSRYKVIDAGTKRIPMKEYGSAPMRNRWEVYFDAETRTVFVYRDEAHEVFGVEVIPEQPPLSDEDRMEIALAILRRGEEREFVPTKEKPLRFYDGPAEAKEVLERIADTIEHPSWCARSECWDRSLLSMINHESDVESVEWEHQSLEHHVDARLAGYMEHTELNDTDLEAMEVVVKSSEMGDARLLGTPEDFERLGKFLIAQAERLRTAMSGA